MTGATGELTPDEAIDDLVPGELREQHSADVTHHHAHRGRARTEPVGPERSTSVGGDTVVDHDERF